MTRSFKRNGKKRKNKSFKMRQYGGEFDGDMTLLDKLNQLEYYGDELIKLDEKYTKINSAYKNLNKKNEISKEAQKLELYNNYLKKYIDELVKLTKKDVKNLLIDTGSKFGEIKIKKLKNDSEGAQLSVSEFEIGNLRNYDQSIFSSLIPVQRPTDRSGAILDGAIALRYALADGESNIKKIEDEFIKKIYKEGEISKPLFQIRDDEQRRNPSADFGFGPVNIAAAKDLLTKFKDIRALFVKAFGTEYISKITSIEKYLTGEDKDYEEYKNTIKSLKDKYTNILNSEVKTYLKEGDTLIVSGNIQHPVLNDKPLRSKPLEDQSKNNITKRLIKKTGELDGGKLENVLTVKELLLESNDTDTSIEKDIKVAKEKDVSEKESDKVKNLSSNLDSELIKKYGKDKIDKASKAAIKQIEDEQKTINISKLMKYQIIDEDKTEGLPVGVFIDMLSLDDN